jgi:CRISPR system Cascade subunit CasA
MLNLTLTDDDGELWEPGFAAWELDTPRTGERIEVPLPRSQAALLTLQSRRVLLERSEDSVVGFKLIGGDFFLKDNAFSEQMTIWRATDKDNVYSPKRHNSSRQLWRDFSALFVKGEKARVPGIVKWLEKLDHAGFISSGHIKMRAASVQYGDKDFFVNDIFDDSISINAGLLSALSEPWIIRINDSLSTTERMVSALGNLAADMAEAAGESFSNNEASKRRRMAHRDKSNENAYFNLDMPFRDWLAGIDPKTDDIDDKIVEWLDNAERIIRGLGRDMAADTGMVAFVGKKTQDGMTSSKAFNKFKNTLYKIRNGERMQ